MSRWTLLTILKMEKQNIADLLKDKKALAKYLEGVQLSDGDVGHAYAEMASAYLRANNYLLRNYNTFLKEVVAELKRFNEKEKTLTA